MNTLFDIDGPFIRVSTKIVDIVWLSILFLICSIPLFTIGASWSALYYAVHKNIRHDRGYATREFFHGFKISFKQSTLATLIFLPVIGIMIWEAFVMYENAKKGVEVYHIYIFLLIAVVLLFMWVIYIFPYIARFSIDFKSVLKNSLILAEGNIARTVTLGLVFVGAVLLAGKFIYAVLFLPTVFMLICDFLLEITFRRYMSDEDRAAEDEKNGLDSITAGLEMAEQKKKEKKNKDR